MFKKVARSPGQNDGNPEQFATCDQLGVELHDIDHLGVLELAQRYGLTSYDASYLWLAQNLAVELVTLDGRLARAAASLFRA